jgi:hypothetical protein
MQVPKSADQLWDQPGAQRELESRITGFLDASRRSALWTPSSLQDAHDEHGASKHSS